MPTDRKKLGAFGERLAAHHLEHKGYRIVERNWRTARGEIDLVAQAGEVLVFVEVKTRRGRGMGTPEESITPHKANKLLELALAYLYEKELDEVEWRVDLVAVELDTQGKLLRCEHLENALPMW